MKLFGRHNIKLVTATICLVLISVVLVGFFVWKRKNIYTVTALDTSMSLQDVTVHFLDVGQADCVLVLYQGHVILIDSGNDSDFDFILGYLQSLNLSKIDYLIFTHPHEDHIGAGNYLVDTFEISKIYMTYADSNTLEFYELLKSISSKNYQITIPACGDKIQIDDLVLEFIGPQKVYDDLNNMSLIVKLSHLDNTFLFMGDAETVSEEDLLAAEIDLQAKVLKVGHHGSQTSSSQEFLKRVSPEYAIISCEEDNDYGHPHATVLSRLYEIGAEILRTDYLGTIALVSDGKSIQVITEKEQKPIQASAPFFVFSSAVCFFLLPTFL